MERRGWSIVVLVLLLFAAGCAGDGWGAAADIDGGGDGDVDGDADGDGDGDGDADGDGDTDSETEVDTAAVDSCDFDYDEQFGEDAAALVLPGGPAGDIAAVAGGVAAIAWHDPPPARTERVPARTPPSRDVVLPVYDDDMPLFARGLEWVEELRCYELPTGARLLTESQAYDLYVEIAEQTTGVPLDTTTDVRTVLGLRGAYPGTFAWHGNTPNKFNDTLVLLWIDGDGFEHVREFPVHTDVGEHYFGFESSSHLRPNRRYFHVNGWHGSTPYNALSIDDWGYRVRNDTNANGHWDDDRNGWLPPAGDDYFRGGSGHNIHMGSVNGPLGDALVDVWSAGCQVIPGMANWTEFILNAWTDLGDPVSYYLVDARDIHPPVWYPCEPDGSHGCPFPIDALPFSDGGDTAADGYDEFDLYNCSDADESGPEIVWVLPLDDEGLLTVTVTCDAPVDIDVHLLEGDDPDACLARGHESLTYDNTPGRYLIVADTYVDGADVLAGEFELTVTLE